MAELDWRAVLTKDNRYELQTGASKLVLRYVEARLGIVLPADLRALYLVTNGVFDKEGQWYVVWPLAWVVESNQWAWAEESAARQRLVGFGDDGTGTPFCVSRDGSPGVYSWNAIDDEARWVADTVEAFWTYWSNGGSIPPPRPPQPTKPEPS